MYAEKFESFINLINQTHRGALAFFLSAMKAADKCDESEDVTLDATTSKTWLQIGGCLASLGYFEEAEESYKIALEIDNEATEAIYGLACIGNFSYIKALLSSSSITRRIMANFACGQYHENKGEHGFAMIHFKAANDLLLEQDTQTVDDYLDGLRIKVDRLITTWAPDVLQSFQITGHISDVPVFIVGMPRSGTTLVEQIVASHSRGFGAGERTDINEIANSLGIFQPENWNRNEIRLRAMGHLSRLLALGRNALRITDKMPDNVFNIGVINALFPNAKIIFCRRDVRDVALSCYFQNFGISFPWSHTLSGAMQRAREIDRLMDHWVSVLPSNFQMNYEMLVQNPEAESKRLLAFLELDWEPECLQFHQLKRQVLTASLWQVRQPIFDTSVGRWKNYVKFCDELKTP